MTSGAGLRFAGWASLVAALSGASAALIALGFDRLFAAYVLLGFGPIAIASVFGGAKLAAAHGRIDRTFFTAFAVGMLVRVVAMVAVVAFALLGPPAMLKACLAGLVAGYVPVQLFEMIWFLRKAPNRTIDARVPRASAGA